MGILLRWQLAVGLIFSVSVAAWFISAKALRGAQAAYEADVKKPAQGGRTVTCFLSL
ncbi:hypothetical protein GCM10023078_21970 [Gibbsiella greigii]